MQNCSSVALNMEYPVIDAARREYPSKLFVETTSRCNLSCVMCMKQNPDSITRDGDLDLPTFSALEAALPNLEALVLNGVGEPLLNIMERDILDIWNSGEFRTYRENVLRHDYPSCSGCNCSPCDLVQKEEFDQDCYVNTEPCGSCLWSSGVFRCLD